jgi:hypothetical protein
MKKHNLDIHMYNFNELLELFGLTYNITIEDLKRAKKVVLMTHPDKSKLGSEYFLFYKKAFDVILQFYENQEKQNRPIPEETQKYEPIKSDLNTSTNKKVSTIINKMNPNEFNQKFNNLFESNMVSKKENTNEWFSKDEPSYNIEGNVSVNNMGQAFDKIKEKQNGIVKYRGVENLYINSASGTNLYDGESDEYVNCDPFSKLKFDDLRKVHKDQTVFTVSERDIQKVPQYSSVDQFMRERGKQSLAPLEKQESEKLLSLKEEQYRQAMLQKQYGANLKTMEYAEKNKSVLSSFLQLKN